MLAKEDIPAHLRAPVEAAVDWINSSFAANFEVTGLADKKVPTTLPTILSWVSFCATVKFAKESKWPSSRPKVVITLP